MFPDTRFTIPWISVSLIVFSVFFVFFVFCIFFYFCRRESIARKQRLERLQQERKEKEKEECTFAPSTSRQPSRRRRYSSPQRIQTASTNYCYTVSEIALVGTYRHALDGWSNRPGLHVLAGIVWKAPRVLGFTRGTNCGLKPRKRSLPKSEVPSKARKRMVAHSFLLV